MTISAEVILDSTSRHGKRLTTMKLCYPRFIHAEFMTHRVFSRNASSSRAIPVTKSIAEVRGDDTRASPIWWGKNQPGMQADEELSNEKHFGDLLSLRERAQMHWKEAALSAASYAERLSDSYVHKQIVNRILEPYLHIRVVASFTEIDNFFGLRLHPAAQPEMRELARVMWAVYQVSEPYGLHEGEWHLPFVELKDYQEVQNTVDDRVTGEDWILERNRYGKAISVARCARVSYESFETGKRSTVAEDLALYEKLRTSGHWSPFEHQATPDQGDNDFMHEWKQPDQHGNFVGWRQLRKMLPNESCASLPKGYNK